MSIERITRDDVDSQHGHVYRYNLAADLILEGERVLDVACGIGYGAGILQSKHVIKYVGVDKMDIPDDFKKHGTFLSGVDLDVWEPSLEWDVSVSFETLEHVKEPQRLANILKRASRLIVLSTPTRPTMHMNPYHLHDFTVDDVLTMFDDCRVVSVEDQPKELSHIFVFETAGQ
jgi:2-polyprenyl-3-methyl-5-hydroxy-6-metoxy-1,4-benzoquinol methylase